MSEEARKAQEARLKYEEELRNNKKLETRTTQMKEEARRKEIMDQQKMKTIERERMMMAQQKAREDSINAALASKSDRQKPLQVQIVAKTNQKVLLEQEISGLKDKEVLVLQGFVKENASSKQLQYEANQKVGVEKLKKSTAALLAEKKALESKLKAKENYQTRLEKQEELNKIRQELNMLQKQLESTNLKIDSNVINGSLQIQYQNILQSREKIKLEIDALEKDIKTKEDEYNTELALLKQEEEKQKKIDASKKAPIRNVKDLNLQMEAFQKDLKNAATPEQKAKIFKEIKELEKSYPEGVYEELITESNRTLKRIVVSRAGKVSIYKMIVYNWGGTFFFKDDNTITKQVFDRETTY